MPKVNKLDEALRHKELAMDAAGRNDYLNASFNIALALKLYGQSNNSEGVKFAKKLLISYNKKAEAQMQTHEFEIELDQDAKDQLEAFVKELTKADALTANFERIIKSSALVPSFAEAQRNAKEIVPLTAQIATHYTIGDEGHLASFDSFDNDWLAFHYQNQLKVTMGILDEAFAKLSITGQLNEKNVMDAVVSRELLMVDALIKLQTTLERRFENDYLSALHILVPLIEKTFMSLSAVVGLDTIAYNGKNVSTRNATLSPVVLKSEEYQKAWGEDFCVMLNFFLLDANGYRFRHKIAHGDIRVNECNMTTFNLSLYFFIKIIWMIKKTPVTDQ